jgi:outer membrane lipoprotein-sorting protein
MQTMELALEPAAGGFKMKQVSRYIVPDQMRQEQEAPPGRITIYSDGKSGWMAVPQGSQPMPAEELKQARGELFRLPPALMLSDRDSTRTVNAVADNAVEISTADGLSVKVEFDPATGLPARQMYIEPGSTGAPAETADIFSDWRDAGGIKMPYKAVQQENGMKILEMTVSEYKFNSGLTAAELSKKP